MWYNRDMNIIQQIFKDHFYDLANTNIKIRKTVFENVERMLHCGDFNYGYAIYGCERCGKMKTVPFRCKSRFCPTCGNLYSIKRSTNMAFKLLNFTHRHCVFTIDENLRHFFLEDRNRLNYLFDAVRSVVLRMFQKDNKKLNLKPGFISVLHTFGRDLKWNPHIHCLISEFGASNSGIWRKKHHFNYLLMRNSFQTALLNILEKDIGTSFKKIKAVCYQKHKNGFYVYAEPNNCQPDQVIKYIGRYLGRPVIASSRIDSYDGERVTFHYNRHEDNKLVTETLHVYDFIKKLIRHIPEKHFKMVRYYGIYARHRESDKKLQRAISPFKHRFFRSLTSWRNSIFLSFNYDPIKCSCGNLMCLLDIISHVNFSPLSNTIKKESEISFSFAFSFF